MPPKHTILYTIKSVEISSEFKFRLGLSVSLQRVLSTADNEIAFLSQGVGSRS